MSDTLKIFNLVLVLFFGLPLSAFLGADPRIGLTKVLLLGPEDACLKVPTYPAYPPSPFSDFEEAYSLYDVPNKHFPTLPCPGLIED